MPKTKHKPEIGYPIYEALIDESDKDDTGMRFVSIVADPAIEVKGMFFSKEGVLKNLEFKTIKDQQMLVGPALIPDKNIFRSDEDGEYYIRFSKDTVQKMVEKFNRNQNNRSINVDHSNRMVDGFIVENWIVKDSVYDKSKFYGFNLPVGTWFVCVKILDSKFWEDEVKGEGKYGFSIEGILYQSLTPMSLEKQYDSINDLIDDLTEEDMLDLFNNLK